jgi:hypothetical protein
MSGMLRLALVACRRRCLDLLAVQPGSGDVAGGPDRQRREQLRRPHLGPS